MLSKINQDAVLAVSQVGITQGQEVNQALYKPMMVLVSDALMAAGRSRHTGRAYQHSIGLFLSYLDKERGDRIPEDWRPLAVSTKEPQQGKGYPRTVWEFRGFAAVLRLVDAALVDGFRSWREHEGDNPNTATLRVYAVRVFLSVALRDGILTDAQGKALGIEPYRQRQVRDEQPTGRRLSVSEVKQLRSAVDTRTNKGKRDLALLDLMLFAGLRREEAAYLDLDDLKPDNGRLWLVFTGKGSKTRRIKIHDVLYRSLTDWLSAAGLQLGTQGCVFWTVNKGDAIQKGACINASVVGRLVSEYSKSSGIGNLAAHDLRRTCARNAYDNGASLLLVQAMLGHTDPKTTARYIGAYQNDDDTAVDYVRYA